MNTNDNMIRLSKSWEDSFIMAAQDILLRCLYIILSLSVVFLPLVALFPSWYKFIPYYRKAVLGLEQLYKLHPDIEQAGKPRSKVGRINKGERGFDELRDAIASSTKRSGSNISSISLVHGDPQISVPVMSVKPNSAVFIDIGANEVPVIYDPLDQSSLNTTKNTLLEWIRLRTQTKMLAYTVIAAVVWVAVMTIYIFR